MISTSTPSLFGGVGTDIILHLAMRGLLQGIQPLVQRFQLFGGVKYFLQKLDRDE